MTAGDAGLERQPVDTVAIRQRLSEVGQLMQEYGNTIHVDGEEPLAEALVDVAKSVPPLLNEIDRLRAQLVAQQAVVEAARGAVNCIDADDPVGFHFSGGGCLDVLDKALRALDKAQAAQLEGERG